MRAHPQSSLTLQHDQLSVVRDAADLHAVPYVKGCNNENEGEGVNDALDGGAKGEAKACAEGGG